MLSPSLSGNDRTRKFTKFGRSMAKMEKITLNSTQLYIEIILEITYRVEVFLKGF